MATIRPDNSKVVKTKIVNINARIPVKTVSPPIYGVKNGVEMSISDILKCLTRRAIIHQVLSDGSTIQLTTKNFREDYEGQLQKKLKFAKKLAKNEEVITEPTIVAPGPDTEPIVEVQDEDILEPTGNIDDLNLVDDIDDDDDNNSEEPEEAGTVVITRNYIDGTKIEQIGIEPKFPEPVDEEDESSEVTEAAEEKPEEAVPAEEVTESEETETTEEPVVSEEKPVSSSTKKKNNNSKKSGSKKK